MKEIPILFSGAMVRALLDGTKTQTRRVVKPQFEREPVDVVNGVPSWDAPTNYDGEVQMNTTPGKPCPYGVPGGRLWVRETFVAFGRWETRFSREKGRDEWHFIDMTLSTGRQYRFEGALPNAKRGGATPSWWTRPSIFMPRAASRITLYVTDVRVERLQDISEADAIAEGCDPEIVPVCCGEAATGDHGIYGTETVCCGTPVESESFVDGYRKLWDSLNAARGFGWDVNPWVWVVEFKRVHA
jgi:hypothetical protein